MRGFERLNLFCMYAVKIEEYEEEYQTEEEKIQAIERINKSLKIQTTINEDMYSLGDYVVVIFNVKKFVSKVHHAVNQLGMKCESRLVEYFDPQTYSGDFKDIDAVFNKRNLYANQQEYRFAFMHPDNAGAMKINAGNLEGIAFRIAVRDFNSKVQITMENKKIR